MQPPETDTTDATTPVADTPSPEVHSTDSVRGSFVFVVVMAALFIASWFAVFAILLERR